MRPFSASCALHVRPLWAMHARYVWPRVACAAACTSDLCIRMPSGAGEAFSGGARRRTHRRGGASHSSSAVASGGLCARVMLWACGLHDGIQPFAHGIGPMCFELHHGDTSHVLSIAHFVIEDSMHHACSCAAGAAYVGLVALGFVSVLGCQFDCCVGEWAVLFDLLLMWDCCRSVPIATEHTTRCPCRLQAQFLF